MSSSTNFPTVCQCTATESGRRRLRTGMLYGLWPFSLGPLCWHQQQSFQAWPWSFLVNCKEDHWVLSEKLKMRSRSKVLRSLLVCQHGVRISWRSNQSNQQLSAGRGKKWTTGNRAQTPALANIVLKGKHLQVFSLLLLTAGDKVAQSYTAKCLKGAWKLVLSHWNWTVHCC